MNEEQASLESDSPAVPEGFYPDTAEKADWVLEKIADAKARASRIRENAEKMAKQAETEATFFEWKFGMALREFARKELETSRRKSLTLYHGSLGFRTTPARVSLAPEKPQEALAVAWAKENLPEAVAVQERLNRAAFDDLVESTEAGVVFVTTGEVLPWAQAVPAEEKFYIK